MAPSPAATAAAELADLVSVRLGWLRLEVGTGPSSSPPPPPLPSRDTGLRLRVTPGLVAGEGGDTDTDTDTDEDTDGDGTARWRAGLTAVTTRQYGTPPPPAYAATFVLQWVLQVLAHPAAEAAALGPFVLDVSAAPLLVDLDPLWWSPRAVLVDQAALTTEPDARRRWERTEVAYRVMATRLALNYDAGVPMSSRQRLGAVRDIWAAAHAQAVGAVPPPWRESCCFLFVLPGAVACAACPRRLPGPPR